MGSQVIRDEAIDQSPASGELGAEVERSAAGGSRELLTLALPLVVSQSFMTVQVFVDAILLSWHDPREMAASFPAVMWFWLPFGLLQVAAGYVSTFVAQYTGAGRPKRVGPAVWQGVHFAILAGLLFLIMVPAAPYLIAMGGHTPALQGLEAIYLRCLCFAALPMLIMAAINGFFSGRGRTWTVLGIEAAGTAVNIALAMLLIFGRAGAPELGIAGAGWATVAGSWVSALTALGLLLRRKYAEEFNTRRGWRPERQLFGRLLKYGLPAGAQVFSDVLVFHVFVQLVGRLGEAQAGATALTVRLNMVAFLPMQGIAQAVSILVGQRLGADRPELAERSTYTGMKWAFGYMCLVASAYVLIPGTLVSVFEGDRDPKSFAMIAAFVPPLLACAAVYSLADAVNLTIAFALRGAGDTRFVSILTFTLAWPLMVIPTYLLVRAGGNLNWAWMFATAYILAMALCFTLRFRSGKWKSMRVIEAAPAVEETAFASP
ncbi:MATE family efflux transporter [Singulisphaera acidiphila]|uniref:Multidrug-efflux transporter n=1 Tax=Singulisphaera acidiphila (strain ATCC BAA-1392 / DSM 18658 / VKM B-2454 / MOB10) TaxID=886293 RepID=L0D6U1_SINAD|nr:MATE family efflux transporter [Singulisphaera acidiphila]AGA24548.1 putative efflux protein, MATE family [Singulisphaera acidiphila DSM 18658]